MPIFAPFMAGFVDELIKTASTRLLREVRKLVEKGTPADLKKADLMVRTHRNGAYAMKDTWSGSQVRLLGKKPSMEGASVLTINPHRGLSATKIYHKEGLAGPGTIAAKESLFRAESGKGGMVGYRGRTMSPETGSIAHHIDYVPGATVSDYGTRLDLLAIKARSEGRLLKARQLELKKRQLDKGVARLRKSFNETKTKRGLEGADLHSGNIMYNRNTKQLVIVDPLVFPAGTTDRIKAGNTELSKTYFGPMKNIFGPMKDIKPKETLQRSFRAVLSEVAPHIADMQKNPLFLFRNMGSNSRGIREKLWTKLPDMEQSFEDGAEMFARNAAKDPQKMRDAFLELAPDVKKMVLKASERLQRLWG